MDTNAAASRGRTQANYWRGQGSRWQRWGLALPRHGTIAPPCSEPRDCQSRTDRPEYGMPGLPARIPRAGPEYPVERRRLSRGNA